MASAALEQRLEQNAAAQAGLAERIRESGVELVYYQFVTLNGRVMAKVAPAQHLARNLERGVQFHGSAVADLATSRHGTLIAERPGARGVPGAPRRVDLRRAAVGHHVRAVLLRPLHAA